MADVKLPPGWRTGELDERVEALRLLPRRVQVVYAAECARLVLPIFEANRPRDKRPRLAIEAAEAWAAQPTAAAADAAYAAANAANAAAYAAAYAYAYDAADADVDATDAYAYAAADAAANTAYAAAYAAADADVDATDAAADANAAYAAGSWRHLWQIYSHARGPEGLVFDPVWRTETAVALARGIRDTRDFDRMPYLADALQDAGCDCPDLMAHLQTDRGLWTCADWSIWNLLGYGD